MDSLMANGSAGPDTFWAAFVDSGVSTSGIQYQSLPAPSDTSRSWRVKISLIDADRQIGTGPILFWLGFMGKEYAVEIPTNTAMETVQLSIDRDVQPEYPGGPTVFVQSLELSPVNLSYVGTYWDAQRKDGQILTRTQLGYTFLEHATRINLDDMLFQVQYQTDTPVDLDQVASIILGDMEFPLDGSDPFPVNVPEDLCPFFYAETLAEETDGIPFFRIQVEELCQKLGADYQWDESTQNADITYCGVTLHLTVGQSQYEVNGTLEGPLSKITQEQLDQSKHPEYARGMILMENGVLTAPFHILNHLPLSYHHLADADGIFTGTLMILP